MTGGTGVDNNNYEFSLYRIRFVKLPVFSQFTQKIIRLG